MSIPTSEELSAFDDPWVDYMLDMQADILNKMSVANLCHMAQSFGLPGSMTEGGQEYTKLGHQLEAVKAHLSLYCLAKGHIQADDVLSHYTHAPPTVKVSQ